jgi:hypothetical protein
MVVSFDIIGRLWDHALFDALSSSAGVAQLGEWSAARLLSRRRRA